MPGCGRAFITIDAEGLPFASSRLMMSPGDPLYGELRKIMTLFASKAAEAFGRRCEGVTVADSHGAMVNIDPLSLKGASIVRGFPRPLAQLAGAGGASIAAMIGFHATQHQGGVLGHTYAGRIIQRVSTALDDDTSEYLLNALALGEMGVPVGLVAGDARLREQVERHTPWAVFVPLKEPISFFSDHNPPLDEALTRLERGIAEALDRLERGEMKLIKPPKGEEWIRVEYKRPYHAELASMVPCVERLDGVTVRIDCGGFLDNYRVFELSVIAAYGLERR